MLLSGLVPCAFHPTRLGTEWEKWPVREQLKHPGPKYQCLSLTERPRHMSRGQRTESTVTNIGSEEEREPVGGKIAV